jgi:hypothetical protein
MVRTSFMGSSYCILDSKHDDQGLREWYIRLPLLY